MLIKWIKHHLRIKSFFGTSQNAVKFQIWIAISVYVLVAIINKKLQLGASLYTLLQKFRSLISRKALAAGLSSQCVHSSKGDSV
ncbi:hypothetical protein MASR1M60_12580 [Rhodocyclaceae bacterium]